MLKHKTPWTIIYLFSKKDKISGVIQYEHTDKTNCEALTLPEEKIHELVALSHKKTMVMRYPGTIDDLVKEQHLSVDLTNMPKISSQKLSV